MCPKKNTHTSLDFMIPANIKYNETHVGILKRKEGSELIEIIHVPISLECIEEMVQLKEIKENDRATYWEFLDFVENGPLSQFTHKFNYCKYLDLPYQGLKPLDLEKEKESY